MDCPSALPALIVGLVCIAIAGALAGVLGGTWPLMTTNPCVSGEHLNALEQMWCTPSETDDVNATFNSTAVNFYRVPNNKLPRVTYRPKIVDEEYSVKSYKYRYYEFEAMEGTKITGTIISGNYLDYCYLMNKADFEHFEYERRTYDDDDEVIYYRKRGIHSLTLNDYELVRSGEYYLVVDHDHAISTTATFDVVINYAVYDMTLFTPVNCTKESCKFNDVRPDETIIAENKGVSQVDVSMNLSDILNVGAIVAICIFMGLFFIIGCLLIILFVVSLLRQ